MGLKGGEIRIKGWGDPDFPTNQREAPESRDDSTGTRPLSVAMETEGSKGNRDAGGGSKKLSDRESGRSRTVGTPVANQR